MNFALNVPGAITVNNCWLQSHTTTLNHSLFWFFYNSFHVFFFSFSFLFVEISIKKELRKIELFVHSHKKIANVARFDKAMGLLCNYKPS